MWKDANKVRHERRKKRVWLPCQNPRIDLKTERYWLDFVVDPVVSTMILGKDLYVEMSPDAYSL